jgi:hypothetical protein
MTSAVHFFNYTEEIYLTQEIRTLCPGEDGGSLQSNELLEVITSHGPSRESYTPAQRIQRLAGEGVGHVGGGVVSVC